MVSGMYSEQRIKKVSLNNKVCKHELNSNRRYEIQQASDTVQSLSCV